MRKSSFLMVALGLSTASLPLSAQDMAVEPAPPDMAEPAPPETPPPVTLSPDQQMMFDAWSAEQQEQYALWPGDVQVYYWTLPAPRQELFWQLVDGDKIALTAMPEEDRESAWQMLEQRSQQPDSEPQ